MHSIDNPPSNFHTYIMEYIADLPLSQDENVVFTVVDKLTNFIRLIPCYMGGGVLSKVAHSLVTHIVYVFSLLSVVLHDRGPRFTANFCQELWNLYGTRVDLSNAYDLQTDG